MLCTNGGYYPTELLRELVPKERVREKRVKESPAKVW